jgi:hypothetical protein
LGPRLASWPSGGEGESGTAVAVGLEASGALARAAEGHDMQHATSLAGREGAGGGGVMRGPALGKRGKRAWPKKTVPFFIHRNFQLSQN